MTDCLKYVHYLLGAAELMGSESSKPAETGWVGGSWNHSSGDGVTSNFWGAASWVFWVSGSGCSSLQGICTPSSRSRVFSFCWSLTILQGTFFTSGWCLPTYNQNYNIHVISPSATSLTEWFFCTAFKGFQHSKLFFYQTALKLGTNVSCASKFTAHHRPWFYNWAWTWMKLIGLHKSNRCWNIEQWFIKVDKPKISAFRVT